MSEWGFVRVGFGPSGVMSSGVMSEWGFVRLPHAIAGIGISITIKIKIVSWSRGW